MTRGKRLMIGDTVITAKVARQLIPTAAIATRETDEGLRQSIFRKGVVCATSGGRRGDCPWKCGITAQWWQEGFDYATAAQKGGAA